MPGKTLQRRAARRRLPRPGGVRPVGLSRQDDSHHFPFSAGRQRGPVARLIANDSRSRSAADRGRQPQRRLGQHRHGRAENAPPDGYTLVLNTMPLVTNQFLYTKVPYDAMADFTPISLISASPSMLTVHPSVPVKSVKDLIALAKSQPGKLNYGTAGLATNPHICGELFNYLAKTNIVAVHFKGGGPALIATMSGETELTFSNISETVPLVLSGRLRGLGVTSLKRSRLVPDIPTMVEAGVPGYEFTTWHALLGPKGLPATVLDTLSEKYERRCAHPRRRSASPIAGST